MCRVLGEQGPSRATLSTRACSWSWGGARGDARAILGAGRGPDVARNCQHLKADSSVLAREGQTLGGVWKVRGQANRRVLRREAWLPSASLGWGRPAAKTRGWSVCVDQMPRGFYGGGELPVARGVLGRTCCQGGSGILPGCSLHPTVASASLSAHRAMLCDRGWDPAPSDPPAGLSA